MYQGWECWYDLELTLMPMWMDFQSGWEWQRCFACLPESYYRLNLRLVCSPSAAHGWMPSRDSLCWGFVIFLVIIDNLEITAARSGHTMATSLITSPTHCWLDTRIADSYLLSIISLRQEPSRVSSLWCLASYVCTFLNREITIQHLLQQQKLKAQGFVVSW